MIPFVEVLVGEGGGPSCGRCSRRAPVTHRPSAEVIADVLAACEAWSGGPGPNVALTSAEPFRHPELPVLVAGAVRAGVKRLRLDTDGTGLADPANAAGVVSAGVRHVRVTVLGAAGAHDALVGVPGAYERAIAGVEAFLAAADAADVRVNVTAAIPVCRHNLHDLPTAVAAVADAGARHVVLKVADDALDLPAAMPWITAACDSGTANLCWVEVADVPLCFAGDHALHFVPVLRAAFAGEKSERCVPCRLDRWCAGVRPGATPQLKALLAPPEVEERLSRDIERAFLAPTGPGEGE